MLVWLLTFVYAKATPPTSTPNILVDAIVERHVIRAIELTGAYITLHKAQDEYSGERDERGCYSFEDDRWRYAARTYQFTAKELGQTANELLCYGFTIPADM